VAIASRFQPRNLGASRFNPFYGEMGGAPVGPGIRRAAATVSGGSPISAGPEFVPDPQDPNWIPPAPDPNIKDYPNPFPDDVQLPPLEEDLGTPWYLQVKRSGAPTMPWNVYMQGGSTNLRPTSNKPDTSGGFYSYTGPGSSISEEVYYEPFYGGNEWTIPESLKTAKASLASMYDDGPSTNLDWPGMEAWLASSGISEKDWNSSKYRGYSGYHFPNPETRSYPFAYNYETGFGDWA
jgi:hypothetical protein